MATVPNPAGPPAAPGLPRQAPARTIEKWNAWKFWSSYWTWTYVLVGSLSSIVSVLVAANTKTPFLPTYVGVAVACSAAVLTFVVNALSAQSKAAAFETAGRELEKAIAAYESDPALAEKTLGDAEQRGIDILNRLKPQ
jgi:glucan phosphoethanolaminetransferase (alkaline phosphatase superfamily)